jgi:hypothetical protein
MATPIHWLPLMLFVFICPSPPEEMVEVNFRKSFPFINNIIFTPQNIPVPINDDEKMLYHNSKTKLYLQLGNGIPAYTSRYSSYSGSIFITNYRIVYRPIKPNSYFSSLFFSLNNILAVEDDESFEINVDDIYSATVFISFEDSQKGAFFSTLKRVLSGHKSGPNKDESLLYEEDDSLPLYCEVYKN